MLLVDHALDLVLGAMRLAYRRTPLAAAWRKVSREDQGVVESRHVEPLTNRPYRLFTRTDHDAGRAAPVLFALHAYSSTSDIVLDGLRLRRRAVFRRGFVLVVPEGTRDAAGNPFWNATAGCSGCGPRTRTVDDLGYLRAVLAQVRARFASDPARVYAVGVSNGAFMAARWAAEPGGDLRGIACLSGSGLGPEDPPYAPSVRVSVLQIHGTHDDEVLFDGEADRTAPIPPCSRPSRRGARPATRPARRGPSDAVRFCKGPHIVKRGAVNEAMLRSGSSKAAGIIYTACAG